MAAEPLSLLRMVSVMLLLPPPEATSPYAPRVTPGVKQGKLGEVAAIQRQVRHLFALDGGSDGRVGSVDQRRGSVTSTVVVVPAGLSLKDTVWVEVQ